MTKTQKQDAEGKKCKEITQLDDTTMSNTNTPTIEYFKCNICNYKFAIPKKESSFYSSFDAKYEHEYVNLLSDMRAHIDNHRQERPNHKIPPEMLLNLFTRVQDQGKDNNKDKGAGEKQQHSNELSSY
jgi:hypothetical protein